MNLNAIILAAGKGTRMKSTNPNVSKVSFEILGKPLVNYVLDSVNGLNPKKIITIIGYGGEKTKSLVEYCSTTVWQKEQLGTGHAIMQVKDELASLDGNTIICCGDTPLLTKETLEKLVKEHENKGNDLTVLSAIVENPFGYGRIIREDNGDLFAIVEQLDCDEEQKNIKEVNVGVYVFKNELLIKHLDDLKNDNKKHEYYLTDLIKIFKENHYKVGASIIEDNNEMMGVNDRIQLATATALMVQRINKKHMLNGVTIIDPNTTYIGPDVEIGADTIVYPNCMILGKTSIGERNEIKSSTFMDTVIVENDNVIGPMANLRPGVHIHNNTRTGAFVEMKKVDFKDGAKAAHLTYLGDAIVGEKTNIGGGTITANYDGKHKFVTEIGKNAFVGTGSTIIAPCHVGDNSYIAGGSTINKDVGENDLAIGRAYQVNKEGYAIKIREKQNKNH